MKFVSYISIGLFACFFLINSCKEPQSPTPNIVFIYADDMRFDAVAAHENHYIQTPNIDALIAGGMDFTNAYCMGGHHGAICMPSRAMLMSGKSLFRVYDKLDTTFNFPMLFEENGYKTFASGKWHNGQESFRRTFEKGNNIFFGGMCDHFHVPLHKMPDRENIQSIGSDSVSSKLFADATIEFIHQHLENSDAPFLTYTAMTAPHDPRTPSQEYLDLYKDVDIPLPENYLPLHPFNNGFLTGRDEVLGAWPRSEDLVKSQLKEYYALITEMDYHIGRIIHALEDNGIRDNTLIIFAADHGLAIGSHGLLGKQSVYEHSMKAPLVINGLDVPNGSYDGFVYLYDLYPTLCDILQLEAPPLLEGISLKKLWEGSEVNRQSLFTVYSNSQRAIRNEQFKLIRYPRVDHTQLFDLKNDPYEKENIAEANPDIVAKLLEDLNNWQIKTSDPDPLFTEEQDSVKLELTGRFREPDKWQPGYVVEKYFPEYYAKQSN